MTSNSRPLTFLLLLAGFLLVATFVGSGCAATLGGGHRDVHASATLGGAAPRMLVAGPARLLHVDVDGRNEVVLYAVARNAGTDADCTSGATGEPIRLRAGASSRIDLMVASNRVVCVGPVATRASLLWHAQKLESAPAEGEKLAMQTRTF